MTHLELRFTLATARNVRPCSLIPEAFAFATLLCGSTVPEETSD
jgi:hypothetical protein